MTAGTVEPMYSLAEAAERFWPCGGMTKAGLRTEARNGHLVLLRIAGKDFVTESAIRAMVEACSQRRTPRECPAPESRPASTSDPADPAGEANGSSWTERQRLARAQVRQTMQQLKERSKRTSRASTGRRQEPTNLTSS
jgi:hypothetical protein